MIVSGAITGTAYTELDDVAVDSRLRLRLPAFPYVHIGAIIISAIIAGAAAPFAVLFADLLGHGAIGAVLTVDNEGSPGP